MKNWKIKAVSTVIALSVLAPGAAFAADAITSRGNAGAKVGIVHHRFLDEKRQEADSQLLELVGRYTPESLEEWKSALAEQEQLMSDIGAMLPVDKKRPELSEDEREKVKAIREGVKNGALTPEDAGEQLKELGVEKFPGRNKSIDRPELSEDERGKVKAIREGVKNGALIPENDGDKMKKLGLNSRKGFDKNNLMVQYSEAVEAGDEAKIKELLPQMLQRLKEKNQALSDRLARLKK